MKRYGGIWLWALIGMFALGAFGGISAAQAMSAGSLLITEVLYNPAATTDHTGEWIEIYNPTTETHSLQGLFVTSGSNRGFTIQEAASIGPGEYRVIANNATLGNSTYGVTADVVYSFSDFVLSEQSDSISIYANAELATLITSITYTSNGTQGWPKQATSGGASMQIEPTLLKSQYTNTGSAWCLSSTAISATTASDLGTPRAANVDCAAIDVDQDGAWEADDCDDTNASLTAWAEYFYDADGDGYGSSESISSCGGAVPAGFVTLGADCTDADASISPGALEICDSIDNDCDLEIDEDVLITLYQDADGDGFGVLDAPLTQCLASVEGYVANATDANDADFDNDGVETGSDPDDRSALKTDQETEQEPVETIDESTHEQEHQQGRRDADETVDATPPPPAREARSVKGERYGKVVVTYESGVKRRFQIFSSDVRRPLLVKRFNQRYLVALHPRGTQLALFDLASGEVTAVRTLAGGRFRINALRVKDVFKRTVAKEVVVRSESHVRVRKTILTVRVTHATFGEMVRSVTYFPVAADAVGARDANTNPATDQNSSIPTDSDQR